MWEMASVASALCMKKILAKEYLLSHHIPIIPFLALDFSSILPPFEEVTKQLGSQHLFVKPEGMGSSVGISKIKNKMEYKSKINHAFLYDEKVIIEKAIEGREIECSILGNELADAAPCLGEIRPLNQHEFYSYHSKYLDPHGAELIIPASLPEEVAKKIRTIAINAFKILRCSGLARVDFFVTSDHEIYLNEINTFPGFTSISMYPKLWEASGVSYTELISKLIELAFARFYKKNTLLLEPAELEKACICKEEVA